MGVDLLLIPLDKANNAYEVGEVEVVQQVGKVRPEQRTRRPRRRQKEARIGVGGKPSPPPPKPAAFVAARTDPNEQASGPRGRSSLHEV